MSGKAFFILRLNDHVQYLQKIQTTVEGGGVFQGTDFHDCQLGKWLYGEGPEEASAVSDEAKRQFDTLFEPHKRFHDESRKAVERQRAGDREGAERAVTEMYKLSATLINILLELDKLSY